MVLDFPTVIAPRRSVKLGGVRLDRERLLVEMNTQSLADVRAMVRNLTVAVTAEQVAAGNPPSVLAVDGKSDKPVAEVRAKTEVIFGTVLVAGAMRELEAALTAAIMRSTRPHSGRLADVTGAWQWRYLPAGGKAPQVVTAATVLPAFGAGDRLALVPVGVPYATLVNRNVANSGRANVAPRKGKAPPASRQNRGFLFHAADTVRRRAAFKLFHVRVVFSKSHMVPGEVMTRRQGTGMIVITARVRRVVRS